MDIESVIAEAVKTAPEQAKAVDPVAQTETPEVKEQDEKTEETQDIGKLPDSELTDDQLRKREANRQSHLKSKLAKLTRQNRELQAKLTQPQQAASPKPQTSDGRPKEEDFQTYAEYIKAEARWESREAVKQELAERDTKASEDSKQNHVAEQKLQRIQEIAAQEQEFAKSNPEYTALYNEYSDFMGNLPIHVAEALMEADNASLALFALMKEGRLESLEDMSPYKLSMEIGKAEIRGETYLSQHNKATNAPTPIPTVRASATPTKDVSRLSGDEILKLIRKR